MAYQDKLAAAAAPYLQPGETVVTAFPGQTKSPSWAVALGVLGMLLSGTKYRRVVITDRRHIVFSGGLFKAATLSGIVGEGPRVDLGQPSGLWWKCEALPETVFVGRAAHKFVVQANAALT